jgi:hypothetical protein
MKEIEWFISYQIPFMSGSKVFIVGPYASAMEAEENALDIGSFEGIAHLCIYKENVDELVDMKLL